jgi:hypothetical protein
MKYPIIILLAIYVIVLTNSCEYITPVVHPECTTVKPYNFGIPVFFVPNKYVFAVGDTLTIKFDFSEEMTDKTENKVYKLKDYKEFYPAVRFIKLDSTVKNKFFFEFADTCDMQLKNMFIQHYPNENNDAGIGFDFDYREGRYYASMSFILKKKGIYYFEMRSESSPEFPGNFEGKCGLRLVNIGIGHNYDTNFDLVKWLLYPNADPRFFEHYDAETEFRNRGGYAFEVK